MIPTHMIFRRHGIVFSALAVLAVCGSLFAWASVWYHNYYPYGWSHSCDTGLMFALRSYAEEHDGHFPAGEATSEASLSLLYPKYADAELLRGKTVPVEEVERILKSGQQLGPKTCGWHYVEGLTLKDDPRIAIFWDKAGLGHNGQRQEGRTVYLLGMRREDIADEDWEQFLRDQQELLAARQAPEDHHGNDAE